MYDRMLNQAREKTGGAPTEANAQQYMENLKASFVDFPDDYRALRDAELAFFYYYPSKTMPKDALSDYALEQLTAENIAELIDDGVVDIEPIVYEDFLPVSAAGIFQSNLGEGGQGHYDSQSNQAIFEQSLGVKVFDMNEIYQNIQQQSLNACLAALKALKNS